ncbi:DUF895 domain membrane protein [Lunasporangiospora selenospora]|uniref:DUF895 domain membrane protein n=1 Tax=Lunasporangiospora selenospora TaxID=979761 RepID=A0A9P6FRD6_9FUNG|nr:DUF895 domain membrane protein [Lunasporangiospora selenospora]
MGVSIAMRQIILMGVICFGTIGMFNAMSSIGNAGLHSPRAQNLAVTSSSIAYIIGFLIAGGAHNMLGPRICVLFGGLTFFLYAGAMLLAKDNENSIYPPLAGVLLGLGTGCIWVTQGAMMMSYPTEDNKGKYIACFWAIFNLGAVLGSILPLFMNIGPDMDPDDFSGATYIVYMVIMSLATLLGIFLAKPATITRDNGEIVTVAKFAGVKAECISILSVFCDWRMLLLIPAFFFSNFSYTYQFNDFNGFNFNIRTRSLNSIIFWVAQILGAVILGYLLDRIPMKRPKRAMLGLLFVALLFMATWIAALKVQLDHRWERRSLKENQLIDYEHGGNYTVLLIIYAMFGFCDAAFALYCFWLMGALSNKYDELSRYAGFFKSIQSLGSAVAAPLDLLRTPLLAYLITNWILCAISIATMFLVCRTITDTTVDDDEELEEDYEYDDDDEYDDDEYEYDDSNVDSASRSSRQGGSLDGERRTHEDSAPDDGHGLGVRSVRSVRSRSSRRRARRRNGQDAGDSTSVYSISQGYPSARVSPMDAPSSANMVISPAAIATGAALETDPSRGNIQYRRRSNRSLGAIELGAGVVEADIDMNTLCAANDTTKSLSTSNQRFGAPTPGPWSTYGGGMGMQAEFLKDGSPHYSLDSNQIRNETAKWHSPEDLQHQQPSKSGTYTEMNTPEATTYPARSYQGYLHPYMSDQELDQTRRMLGLGNSVPSLVLPQQYQMHGQGRSRSGPPSPSPNSSSSSAISSPMTAEHSVPMFAFPWPTLQETGPSAISPLSPSPNASLYGENHHTQMDPLHQSLQGSASGNLQQLPTLQLPMPTLLVSDDSSPSPSPLSSTLSPSSPWPDSTWSTDGHLRPRPNALAPVNPGDLSAGPSSANSSTTAGSVDFGYAPYSAGLMPQPGPLMPNMPNMGYLQPVEVDFNGGLNPHWMMPQFDQQRASSAGSTRYDEDQEMDSVDSHSISSGVSSERNEEEADGDMMDEGGRRRGGPTGDP